VFHALIVTLYENALDISAMVQFFIPVIVGVLAGYRLMLIAPVEKLIKLWLALGTIFTVQMICASLFFDFSNVPFILSETPQTKYSAVFGAIHRGGRYGSLFSEASYYLQFIMVPFVYSFIYKKYLLFVVFCIGIMLAGSLTGYAIFSTAMIFLLLNKMQGYFKIKMFGAYFALLLVFLMVYYTLYLVDQNIIGADKIWSFGTKLLGLNFALEHLIDHPFGIGPTNLNVMALDLDLNLSSGYIELLVFFGWMAFPLFTPLVPIANALSNNTDKSLFSIRVGVLCVVLLSFVHGPTFNLFNTMMLSYVFLYRERSGANRCYGYQ
tara:strand:- start:3 stop:971 length:969 start_codon:yes stop_codon:yes gene_type:complete